MRLDFKRVFVVCCIMSTMLVSAKEIMKWDYSNGKMPFIPKENITFNIKHSSSGKRSLVLKIASKQKNALAHSIQVLFQTPLKLEAKTHYQIIFDLKSDRKDEFSMNARMTQKPWSEIPGSYRKILLSGKWQRIRYEFVADKSYEGGVCAPMLMLGNFPVGGTLEIGPVILEKVMTDINKTKKKHKSIQYMERL